MGCCWNLDLTQRDYDSWHMWRIAVRRSCWNLDLTQRDYDYLSFKYREPSLSWNLDLTQRDYDTTSVESFGDRRRTVGILT